MHEDADIREDLLSQTVYSSLEARALGSLLGQASSSSFMGLFGHHDNTRLPRDLLWRGGSDIRSPRCSTRLLGRSDTLCERTSLG